MAIWFNRRIVDIINEVEDGKFVLPVIQRGLVWEEIKMTRLYDSLLKGDSFGGIMVIEEEKGNKPLFSYRPFTKDGNFIPSSQVNELNHNQFFVIDGQQRLQSFYIGLKGSINGKQLYFDLFSDFENEYEFRFEKEQSKLPRTSKENEDRPLQNYFWYSAKDLLRKLKDTNDEDQVSDEIITKFAIQNDVEQTHIRKNIKAFYKNIISSETLGIAKVVINRTLPEVLNRQRIVELFKRLNDGGTRLSAFDLVASILKGYSWEMESFLSETLEGYQDIGLTQDNLIKLIFILQDNHSKEMASIEADDAEFAIKNRDRIQSALIALKEFLTKANLYDYYKEGNRSFIPLFFIVYHLFYKEISNEELENYFNNFETTNVDFLPMRRWIYNSLLNGVFKSKGAGWIPYRTGIRKILEEIKNFKGKVFPTDELFKVYYSHGVTFSQDYNIERLDELEPSFVYYIIYDFKVPNRINDIDHIMPKNILEKQGVEWEKINSIKNYQLLDFSTNRGEKNGKPLTEWIANFVESNYINLHLIPKDKNLWKEENFAQFSEVRGQMILQKILDLVK